MSFPGPLISNEELAEMAELANRVSTGDRWERLCREVLRIRSMPEDSASVEVERELVLTYLYGEAGRLNRDESCPSIARRVIRRLIGAIERGEHRCSE